MLRIYVTTKRPVRGYIPGLSREGTPLSVKVSILAPSESQSCPLRQHNDYSRFLIEAWKRRPKMMLVDPGCSFAIDIIDRGEEVSQTQTLLFNKSLDEPKNFGLQGTVRRKDKVWKHAHDRS